jgi:AbrB family looped-hinge helix DNA binding protein
MSAAATTTLSSKGQVVIPEEIRLQLGLEPGVRFVVIADRDVVIFKRLDPPSLGEFSRLVTRARHIARQTGMTRTEVTGAVKKARRSR